MLYNNPCLNINEVFDANGMFKRDFLLIEVHYYQNDKRREPETVLIQTLSYLPI